MNYEVRAEQRYGPGPYSVYVNGEYLTTVDTKAEVEKVKREHRTKVAEGDASEGRVAASPA